MGKSAQGRRLRLLVVGNGPTGVDRHGQIHVDRSAGQLLERLAAHAAVTFTQPVEAKEATLNYFGHVLDPARVGTLQLDRSSKLGTVAGAASLLRAIVRADLVYLFYPGTLPRLVGRLCRAFGKPFALFLRGGQFESSGHDRALFTRARFILCVSDALARVARTLNPRTSVVRSAEDLRREDAWVRPPAGGEARELHLLFVGRIDHEKGVPELIDAARELHASGDRFQLTVVGFGRWSEDLERALAEDPRLPIRYLGEIDDRARMLALFREADVFVLPSHHEGFARVLYEAMLQSCAVISTMVGGIPAVLEPEVNCLAIPVGNPQAIADAVRRLTADPELRLRIAQRGHETVLKVIAQVPLHIDALIGHLDISSGQG